MPTHGFEITPRDELSKLPLPVFVRRRNYSLSDNDYHHAFHPRKSLDLGHVYPDIVQTEDLDMKNFLEDLELEGKAVRYSRGQLLPKRLHQRYHDIFAGPELPISTTEKFGSVVLSLSGVVPRQAIYLTRSGDYQVRGLSNSHYNFLNDSSRMYHEDAHKENASAFKREWFGRFFAKFALEQSLTEIISESVINEFLRSSDEIRKRTLGNTMLEAALNTSLDTLTPVYREARREGMVLNPLIEPFSVVPRFITERTALEFHQSLENTLQLSIAA